MKNANDRIIETLQYLRGWTGGANAQYATLIANQIETLGFGGNMPAISAAMSQGGYLIGNDAFKTKRETRRALTLIRAALLGQNPTVAAQGVKNLADSALDTQLNTDLGQVRTNSVNALQTAWAQFANNTAAFLQNNTINVRSNKSRGVQTFNFCHDPGAGRYAITPTNDLPPRFLFIQVQVNHVPVTKYDDVKNNLGAIDGVDLDPNYPVVTTQLTGCSYMYQVSNTGQMKAAHIWPAGSIAPTNLTTTLRGGAGFAHGNGGAVTIFGAEAANGTTGYLHSGTWTYVVARDAGGWQIHAQQVPQNQVQPRTYTRIL